MKKRSVVALMLVLGLVMACGAQATVWNVTDDAGLTNPSGAWSYMGAGNPQDWGTNIDIDPSAYTLLPAADITAARVMWYSTLGNVWSTPQVRFNDYSYETRTAQQRTDATHDSIIAWTSPIAGEISIVGWVQDVQAGGGTGILRISQYDGVGLDDNVLSEVTITNDAAVADQFSLTTTVEVGDVIYLRKTFYKWDDYGCAASNMDVTITTIPEPISLVMLSIGGLALLRKRG